MVVYMKKLMVALLLVGALASTDVSAMRRSLKVAAGVCLLAVVVPLIYHYYQLKILTNEYSDLGKQHQALTDNYKKLSCEFPIRHDESCTIVCADSSFCDRANCTIRLTEKCGSLKNDTVSVTNQTNAKNAELDTACRESIWNKIIFWICGGRK
jgi:hypothetical protein